MKIAVAGAGVFGRLVALRLSECGHDVALFDKAGPEGAQSCAFAAAGMLAPYCELESAPLEIAELGLASLELWPEILSRLIRPVFFRRSGSLVVAAPGEEVELSRFQRKIERKLAGEEAFQEVSPREFEPELDSRLHSALFFPLEGQIDSRGFLSSAAETLAARGIDLRWNEEVLRLEPGMIFSARGRHRFDCVIDTRGLGAKQDRPRLRGVRGELVVLESHEVQLQRPVRLLHPRHPIYLVPRPLGRFLLGATSIESEDSSSISLRSMMELLSTAFVLTPALAEARVIESCVGLRPAFPDHMPKIDVTDGLISVNGLYRHGFLLAPALVERVLGSFVNLRETQELQA